MIEYVVCACVLTGTFFIALSAIGLLRMPTVYARLHAVSKATTLGIAGVLIGSGLMFLSEGYAPTAEVLTLVFMGLSNPAGAHMIARSAYLTGVQLADGMAVDELDRAGAHRDVEHDIF